MTDPKIDDGGPVFPQLVEFTGTGMLHDGMTLRDYAIVHFMAALMQRHEFDIQTSKLMLPDCAISPRFLAAEQADAMLATRKKKG